MGCSPVIPRCLFLHEWLQRIVFSHLVIGIEKFLLLIPDS